MEPFADFHLLRGSGEDKYRGSKTPLRPPPLIDMLQLPKRGGVGSPAQACDALEKCKRVCGGLLERAYSPQSDGGGSARLVIQSHVMELITELFTDVLPTLAAPGRGSTAPLPSDGRKRRIADG